MYYRILGNHVHCRLFAGNGPTLGKCGLLVFSVEEFFIFKNAATFIEYRDEDNRELTTRANWTETK
jgi:hypothetical protein